MLNDENIFRAVKRNRSHDSLQFGRIQIDRPVYAQSQFEKEFCLKQLKNSSSNSWSNRIKSIAITLNPLNLFRIFTIIDLFGSYSCRKYLIPDILSGITGINKIY